MLERNCVPLQIIRRQTFINEKPNKAKRHEPGIWARANVLQVWQHPLAAVWFALGLLLRRRQFPSLKRRSGDLVYASVAQAFSNQLEPFALKGDTIPRDQTRNKRLT